MDLACGFDVDQPDDNDDDACDVFDDDSDVFDDFDFEGANDCVGIDSTEEEWDEISVSTMPAVFAARDTEEEPSDKTILAESAEPMFTERFKRLIERVCRASDDPTWLTVKAKAYDFASALGEVLAERWTLARNTLYWQNMLQDMTVSDPECASHKCFVEFKWEHPFYKFAMQITQSGTRCIDSQTRSALRRKAQRLLRFDFGVVLRRLRDEGDDGWERASRRRIDVPRDASPADGRCHFAED
jgi:hypothetical protein